MGPVGATLGALLARAGVTVIIVESSSNAYPLPRAVQFDHEVLRLLQLAGIPKDLLEQCQTVEGYEFVTTERELLMGFYPPSRLAPTGYAWNTLGHQPTLEAALHDLLEDAESVTTLTNARLTALSQNESGVNATIQTRDGQREIEAQYLVGCDGARSTVRSLLDIEFEDLGFDEPWLVVDTLLPANTECLSRNGLQLCDPARPTTSMPSGSGRHRWEFMLLPHETEEEISRPERVKALLGNRIDTDTITIERTAVHHFHALFAAQWHCNRTLLAGDAAHQMPPFMGQGLCSGVRDAANIAWKLAGILDGSLPPSLLGTVQKEREPQVREITSMAMDMGKLVCMTDVDAANTRDSELLAKPIEERRATVAGVPGIVRGVLQDCGGGRMFPEPKVVANNSKADLSDVAGLRWVLVVTSIEVANTVAESLSAMAEELPSPVLCIIHNEKLVPSDQPVPDHFIVLEDVGGELLGLLGSAECLMARPDKVVFASGNLHFVIEQWRSYLVGARDIDRA